MIDLARNLTPSLIGLGFHQFDGTRDLSRGTAFPASADIPGGLLAGDRFWRTDIGVACYYDGTRWLTVHQYSEPLLPAPGIVVPKTDAAYVNNQSVCFNAAASGYGIYFNAAYGWMFVATTNNGSNYWELEITNTGTSCGTFSTAADAANTNLYKSATTPVVLAAGRQYWQLRTSNNVGAPGNLSFAFTVFYRLIIT